MSRAWVVVPCYNEERRLDRGAFEAFLRRESGPTLLFVDDGSRDRTREVLHDLAATNPARAKVLESPDNRGKAEAVRLGMRSALAEGALYVGFWDADLATPLAQIAEFAAVLDDQPWIDVVMGSRVRMLGRSIERYGSRHLVGRFYATMASFVLALPVYDTQCGAKLFRTSPELADALAEPFRSGWSFDVELLQRLQHAWGDRGFDRIVELPLLRWRHVGDSKVSLLGGAAAFVALFRLLFRSGRSLPLTPPPSATDPDEARAPHVSA